MSPPGCCVANRRIRQNVGSAGKETQFPTQTYKSRTMTDQLSIEYRCSACGFLNRWSRDEILQRGRKKIFKDAATRREDFYSLLCKNPAMQRCTERYVIAVERVEN